MNYRPIYESSHDRSRESIVAHAFAATAGLTVAKMPALCPVDFQAYEDETSVAYLEIKCRNNPRHQYSTYMISKDKIDKALAMAQESDVAFVLVIRWTDGIYFHVINDTSDFAVREGGRWDRGDPKDVELTYHIPTDQFRFACPA